MEIPTDDPLKRSALPEIGLLIRGARIMCTLAVTIGALLESPDKNRSERRRAYEGLIRYAAQSAIIEGMPIHGLLLELATKSIAKAVNTEVETESY